MSNVKSRYGASLSADDFEPKHLGYLLGRVTHRMRRDIWAAAQEQGDADRFGPLTGGSFRVLSIIPREGARVTDLARIARMTKQAFGQFVTQLEGLGYLASAPLETDRRVRLVTRTPLGDEAVAVTNQLYRKLEQRWRRSVGAERWDAFHEVLLDLAVGWDADEAERAAAALAAQRSAR
jgi:DNA-binding MarR family transcriptional regulator